MAKKKNAKDGSGNYAFIDSQNLNNLKDKLEYKKRPQEDKT